MATNGRPVTRIHVNYGSLGTVMESRALSPVLIAPRYIVHGYKDGYANGYLGRFDATKSALTGTWPFAATRGTKIDTNNVKLYVGNPVIALNSTDISGTITGVNKITLTELIQGSGKSKSLGDYSVNVGDRIDVTVTSGTSATTISAKITGISTGTDTAGKPCHIVNTDVVIDSTPTTTGDAVTCIFSSSRYFADYVEVSGGITVDKASATAPLTIATDLNVKVNGDKHSIKEGDIYIGYRELVTEGSLSLVSHRAENSAEWAGVADPQNPMGLMAAVAGAVEGSSYFMIATEGEAATDYIKAINYVAQFEVAYALVPYSTDPIVRAAVIDVIGKYASPEIAHYKRCWVAPSASGEKVICGSLTASMAAGGAVTVTSGNLITAGVVPGDFVVFHTTTGDLEYEISKTVGETKVTVQASADETRSDTSASVIRRLDNVEYAKALATEASSVNSARVNMVWGDGITALGYTDLPVSIACVALAAQRSALPPHAPMTDLVVPGIITQDSLKFTDVEYEILNAGGVWVINNNSDGETVTYHQITTKTDGTMAEEDSCVSNGDAVIRYFRTAIKSMFNGSMNVYEGLIPIVKSQLVAQAEAIKVIPFPDIYGPMLVDFGVKNIYRPDSNKGSIVVDCTLEFVRPYAGGEFTFNLI